MKLKLSILLIICLFFFAGWQYIRWQQPVKIYNHGRLLYNGQVLLGMPHGQGTSYYLGGQVNYRGGYWLGKRDSQGVLYSPDGKVLCKGEWKGDGFRKTNL